MAKHRFIRNRGSVSIPITGNTPETKIEEE